MLGTPQPVEIYEEEGPVIPFCLSVCKGLEFAGDLAGATYTHEIKDKSLGTVLAIGVVDVTIPVEPDPGVLAEGTITYTATQIAAIGPGEYKHKMKITLASGTPYVVIPPSEFTINKC